MSDSAKTDAGVEPAKKRGGNVANLKPFRKGEARARLSPGRPKMADLVEALRRTYCYPGKAQNLRRLIKIVEKKHSDMIFHYLSGKPVERIDLSGELKHTADPGLLAAAKVAAQALRNKQV